MILSTSPVAVLLLQGLVPLADKPRDLSLLAWRGRIGTWYGLHRIAAFGSGAFRRRPLVSSPPALERRFIAFPVG